MKNLYENLDYHDLVGQIDPEVSVDEYSAKIGSDDKIVTMAFIVKGKQASTDLVNWLERGYNFIIDAEVSKGQYSPGKYVVFVEMHRRTSVPEKIYEILQDLETLTDIPINDWKIKIDKETYSCDVEQLKKLLILSPQEYRKDSESELNEMRELSGLNPQTFYSDSKDSLIKDFISKAGL